MIHYNRNEKLYMPCNVLKRYEKYNLILKDGLSKDSFSVCVIDTQLNCPLWFVFEIDSCCLPSGRYNYYLTTDLDTSPGMFDIDYIPRTKITCNGYDIMIVARGIIEIK